MSDTDILTTLYRACNPLAPATQEFYVDCSDVRGRNAFTKQFCKDLGMANTKLKRLFSGHIGSGKSSELQHLRQKLSEHALVTPRKRYFPVLMDATEYLNEADVAVTDILLAIVAEIGDAFRTELQIDLTDTYFKKRWDEVKSFFLSDVELSEGEISLPNAKAKIKLLRTDPELRKKVRAKLQEHTASLLDEINLIITEARLKLRQISTESELTPYEDVVLILDNFEKMSRLSGHADGLPSQRALFIDNAPQFLKLDVHLVLTVPLPLARSEGQLASVYGKPPFVLPMIKAEERDAHKRYDPGHRRMSEIVQRRADGVPLEEIFDIDALDFLITYCGGDVRGLMSYVQQAATEVEKTPIDLSAAHRALGQTIGYKAAAITPAQWEKLAQLERSPNQQIDNSDADYRKMLQDVNIVEYLNGVDDASPFEHGELWYAVHPIIREASSFKLALAALDAEKAQQAATPSSKND